MKPITFYTILSSIIIATLIICVVIIVSFLNTSTPTSDNQGNMENNTNTEELQEMMMNSQNTLVKMQTNFGTLFIELFTEESPITAGNFKTLVEEGFYDGIQFHRIIPDFMIQGGDPLTKNESLRAQWGTGGPGYTIEDEFIEGLSNTRGTLSMANSGPNSGGSQFFINIVDNIFLDFDEQPLSSRHPVFGQVIVGMEIVDEISVLDRNQRDVPNEAVIIERATIIQ